MANIDATGSSLSFGLRDCVDLVFTNEELGSQGAAALGSALIRNRKVHTVRASRCGLGDTGVVGLARGIGGSAVQTLYLQGNGFGLVGADALGRAIELNPSIQNLFLSSNQIGDAGVVALIEGMERGGWDNRLSTLYLIDVGLSDAGAVTISQLLSKSSALEELHLSNNAISDTGAQLIASALADHTKLRSLHLSKNVISDVGVAAFGAALRSNRVLTELNLGGNNATTAPALEAIEKQLAQTRAGLPTEAASQRVEL